jgi:hypothetical protein
MNQNFPEVIINATRVSADKTAACYDFVLDHKMQVVECGYVESLARGLVRLVPDFERRLQGQLFEFNHVRINPRLDNTGILSNLAIALESSGVRILNRPGVNMMAVCFKPLGELSHIVRFYLNKENSLIFLSPAVKLRVV